MKKLIQHFAANMHLKLSTTILFNIRQGQTKSLQKYFARFNEETIKVYHPNQELFLGAFQHDLRVGKFNESLAQNLTSNMNEIITRVECYIKGEESNLEKRTRDTSKKIKTKEEGSGRKPESTRTTLRDRPHERATQRPNRCPFKLNNMETLLNTRTGDIFQEVAHMNLIPEAPCNKRGSIL